MAVPSPRDYFDLQLRAAASWANAGNLPFATSVARYTNIRRRLGLQGEDGIARWNELLQVAGSDDPHNDVLIAALDFHAARTTSSSSRFGCFSYDTPDESGVVRIHFMPQDHHRQDSPLGAPRLPERRRELQAMVADIHERQPRAGHVRGASWLYNLAAYRSLFPHDYVASLVRPARGLHLTGTSTWGQVLDFRGEIKPTVRDHLLARIGASNVDEPWCAFPLSIWSAQCALECFRVG